MNIQASYKWCKSICKKSWR